MNSVGPVAAPTQVEPGRRRRLTEPLVVGALALSGAVALHLRDPHAHGSWGLCPFRLLTGLDCPGCGGLRAVNDLTNLDLAGAASSNLLLVALIPVAVAGWLLAVRRAWVGPRPERRPALLPSRRALTIALVVLGMAFTVVRNLPVGSWLAA